ncbi:MAG TPA: GNAT family N-acetyltransferase [bacterium]|nr:GNAT family N-acetyltransferase [bacterium]
MKLREKIVETDLKYIREILESTEFFYDFEIATAVELGEETLAKGKASGYQFVFLEDEDLKPYAFGIYGEIACTKNRYDLYWLGVLQSKRGKGTGSILLKACEDAIAKQGGKIVYIETSARDQYLPTREFYIKRGYFIEAILKDFYDDGDGKVIYSKRV